MFSTLLALKICSTRDDFIDQYHLSHEPTCHVRD